MEKPTIHAKTVAQLAHALRGLRTKGHHWVVNCEAGLTIYDRDGMTVCYIDTRDPMES